ncbi:DUF5719 family protein [Lipingzhangella sp. LS1_29]|uniref:DUF5719 family protein n=1 Tax=Lipingzhangella rawalii TaxID=2055835 RepID=A0ABU2H504_9ACTN|nr:DUF5719 family protein [Lipingzhangella rawalii]MDS1270385.1 DUF5719 family protein [Lipingzhangella rawalii]
MRLFVENRFALLGLVMVALFTLLAVAHLTRPDSELAALDRGEAMVAPVESAVRVCPHPPGGDDAEIRVFSGPQDLAELGDGEADAPGNAGEAIAMANTPDEEVLAEGAPPGEPWTVDPGDADEQVVVRASGRAAQGLEVTQYTVGDGDGDAAAADLRCGEPGLGEWFLAPGGGDLDELELFLANVDDAASTVNIDIYAADGPVYEPDHRGIAIDAHDELSLDLLEATEVSSAVAVHVRTNRGRVAASLFGGWSGPGTEWVPPATAPAGDQVIPGLPPGGGARQLVVATPEDQPAEARVRLFTPDGEVEHDSLDRLDVPPAASATLSLEGQLDEEPATVVVESEQPVVAGVIMTRDGGDADAAYTAAAPPLEQPLDARSLLTPTPDTEGGGSVVVGAPDAAAEVRLIPLLDEDADAWVPGPVTELSVARGHTEQLPLDELDGVDDLDDVGVIQVLLAEGSGPVYAAHLARHSADDDTSTSIRPLRATPDRVALPVTGDSLSSVVP